ncbi:MAG: hypothetical protein ACHQ1G_00040 [Planctomycetota bacterium]
MKHAELEAKIAGTSEGWQQLIRELARAKYEDDVVAAIRAAAAFVADEEGIDFGLGDAADLIGSLSEEA